MDDFGILEEEELSWVDALFLWNAGKQLSEVRLVSGERSNTESVNSVERTCYILANELRHILSSF
jgi:hypothetical protein